MRSRRISSGISHFGRIGGVAHATPCRLTTMIPTALALPLFTPYPSLFSTTLFSAYSELVCSF